MVRLLKAGLAVVAGLILMVLTAAPVCAAEKGAAAKAKARVSQIHVIRGCTACEAMQAWLKKGGVTLEIVNVQQGAYALYPTVVYSDRTSDHGDRMYRQQVQIPRKLCVVVCEYGTE